MKNGFLNYSSNNDYLAIQFLLNVHSVYIPSALWSVVLALTLLRCAIAMYLPEQNSQAASTPHCLIHK